MQASLQLQHEGSRVCRLLSSCSTRALECAGFSLVAAQGLQSMQASLYLQHEGSGACRLLSSCSTRALEHAGFSLVAARGLQNMQASLQLKHEGSRVCRLLSSCSTRALQHVTCAVCGAGSQLLPGLWDLSSPTRDQTLIPWIRRQIFNHWTIREVPPMIKTANIYTFMKAFISVREGWITDKVMGTFYHSFKK